MSDKDGSAAFPCFGPVEKFDEDAGKYRDHYVPMDGMSLRDYFAAKAMQAIEPLMFQHPHTFSQLVAEKAYEVADAMLEARKK